MIETTLPTQEDYRRYDRVWQRVSPSLDPYPAVRAEGKPRPSPPEVGGTRPAPPDEAETLQELLRDELADAQTYRALAPLAPTAEGKRLMRALAAEESAHAKTLQAAYFLLTGELYRVSVALPPQPRLPWRDRLRERYREEALAAQRYAEAAKAAGDMCRKRLFAELSEDERRHAERLRKLLEKAL